MMKILSAAAAIALTFVPVGNAVLTAAPPPAGGTISVAMQGSDGMSDAAAHVFVDAIGAALTARGFTVFDDAGHAASAVEIVLSRSVVGTGFEKVPGQRSVSVAGAGVGVPFGTGASEATRLLRTRLELRIRRRGDAAIVWDGTAVTVRETGTAKGSDAAVAADLCRALLLSYPVQPKDVVGVP